MFVQRKNKIFNKYLFPSFQIVSLIIICPIIAVQNYTDKFSQTDINIKSTHASENTALTITDNYRYYITNNSISSSLINQISSTYSFSEEMDITYISNTKNLRSVYSNDYFYLEVIKGTGSTLSAYKNSSYYSYVNKAISLFYSINNDLAFCAYIKNSKINVVQYTTSTETISSGKEMSTASVLNMIDCESFKLDTFVCVFGQGDTDENFCILQAYDENNLDNVGSMRNLTNFGCYNTTGIKIFSIDGANMLICFLRSSKLYCLKGIQNRNSYDGKVDSTEMIDSCSSNKYDFDIGSFGDENFIVTCTSGRFIYLTIFTGNLEILYSKIQIDPRTVNDYSTCSNSKLPSVVYLTEYNTLLTYSCEASFYYYVTIPTCNLIELTTGTNQKILINFDEKVVNDGYEKGRNFELLDLPSKGEITHQTASGTTTCEINEKYPIDSSNLYYYQPDNTLGTYNISFIAKNDLDIKSTNCIMSFTVKACYESCYSCEIDENNPPSNTVHQCKLCNNDKGYFEIIKTSPLINTINCVNDTTKDSNFYFDSTDQNYKQCDISCKSCKDDGPGECLECNDADDYHWSNEDHITCVNSPPDHTYLDQTDNTYKKCFESCNTCNKAGNITENNCLTCYTNLITGIIYFNIDNYTGNCVNETIKDLYYTHFYKDSSENKYKECNIECKMCQGYSYKCLECAEDYYMYINNSLSSENLYCSYKDKQKEGYFLDTSNITGYHFEKCSSECKTCVTEADNCLSCPLNKYLLYNKCQNHCTSPTYGVTYNDEGFCIFQCPNYFYTNEEDRLCVNCASTNTYLYKGKCVPTRPSNTYMVNNEYNVIEDCYSSCGTCDYPGTLDKMNCISCIDGFKALFDQKSQCYKNMPDGYYEETNYFMPCYKSCLTCEEGGNDIWHNCTSCKEGYVENLYLEGNCEESCQFYWFIDTASSTLFTCTEEEACPKKYPYLNEETKECAKTCDSCYNCSSMNYLELDYKCVTECPENSLLDLKARKCHTLNNLTDLFNEGLSEYIKENLNISSTSGNDCSNAVSPNKYLIDDNLGITLSICNSTSNGLSACKNVSEQLGFTYLNISNCLNSLKNIYQNTEYFYFSSLDIYRSDTSASQVYYEIYDSKGNKIPSPYCINTKINKTKSFLYNTKTNQSYNSVYMYDKQGIDILNYDEKNSFFTDICKTFENENHFDILLNDRYNDFYYNKTYFFCEENCNLININFSSYQVTCECLNSKNTFNTSDQKFEQYKIESQKYYDKFLQYIACPKLVFRLDIMKGKNIGNFILLSIFVIQLILCIYFFCKGVKSLYSYIHNMIINMGNAIGYNDGPNIPTTANLKPSPPPRGENDEDSNGGNSEKENESDNEKEKEKKKDNREMGNEYAKLFILNNNYSSEEPPKANFNLNGSGASNGGNNSDIIEEKQSDKVVTYSKSNSEESEVKGKEDDTTKEKGKGSSFCKMYTDVIKKKHPYVNLFINNDVYDLFSLKLSTMFLGFTIDFLISMFFVFNSHISDLYKKNNKKFDLLYEIGFGVLITFICFLVMKFIRWGMEFKSKFQEYEGNKEKMENDRNQCYTILSALMRNVKLKFGFYFLLSLALTVFVWYAITAYCEVYPNSFKLITIRMIVIIVLSIIFPLLFYLLFVFLKYISLGKKKRKKLKKFAEFWIDL